MVSLRSVALLDRGELLAKWKDHSRVVEEELRACTVEAKALSPLVHALWVSGSDASALTARVAAALERASGAAWLSGALASVLDESATKLGRGFEDATVVTSVGRPRP